jgi:pheromone shutdown-related protein TraB
MYNIHIIGTSHISSQSIKEIEDYIEHQKPGIVAVELDENRYQGLLHKKKPSMRGMFQVGFKGWLFGILGHFVEKKLGESVGVSPGSEMMSAIKLAKKHQLQVAFIDQNIEITLKRLSGELTWKDKWNFFVDIIKGIFSGKKQMKELGLESFDLTKVPEKELIKKLMARVKLRYPSFYRVLLTERNRVMARNLLTLSSMNPDKKILAICGAGHVEGIEEILSKSKQGLIDYTYSVEVGGKKISSNPG